MRYDFEVGTEEKHQISYRIGDLIFSTAILVDGKYLEGDRPPSKLMIFDESPVLKMIEVLSSAAEPLEMSDVFQRAWGVRWSKDRHVNTVAAALNRLNAKGASYSVVRRSGKLWLASTGYCI